MIHTEKKMPHIGCYLQHSLFKSPKSGTEQLICGIFFLCVKPIVENWNNNICTDAARLNLCTMKSWIIKLMTDQKYHCKQFALLRRFLPILQNTSRLNHSKEILPTQKFEKIPLFAIFIVISVNLWMAAIPSITFVPSKTALFPFLMWPMRD